MIQNDTGSTNKTGLQVHIMCCFILGKHFPFMSDLQNNTTEKLPSEVC